MRLIVGLGNLGEKYENTRHNVGFQVADRLVIKISNSKFPIPNFQFEKKFKAETVRMGDVVVVKPQTFMNESGTAVASLCKFFKIHNSDLFVVHDDLDLKLGEYKIQMGVGPKLHNGIASIEEKLRTLRQGSGQAKDFWRVRIGVDNREIISTNNPISNNTNFQSKKRISGEAYVLQDFSENEKNILDNVLEKVTSEILGTLKVKK